MIVHREIGNFWRQRSIGKCRGRWPLISRDGGPKSGGVAEIVQGLERAERLYLQLFVQSRFIQQ